ncbi:MAG: hypothetical protein J5642_04580 [Bacteroidales bacterium]|nr:hypothetical protein [Bacteroidales bacterium]
MSIISEHSLWFSLLCILLGAVYATALYLRNRETDYDRRAKVAMPILRGLAVALVAFLLLAPMLKHNVKEVDKPLLIVAVDNSESMVATADSSFYRQEFQDKINQLVSSFGEDFDVKTYLIGEENQRVAENTPFHAGFTDKTTRLSSIFEEVENLYSSHNIGAMVLVSDGIYNAGSNPQYLAERAKYPVYTIAAGDTTVQTDLLISGIIHNAQTYIGNYFPVEIKVSATHLSGQKAQLTVFKGDESIYTKTIDIRGNQHFETVKLTLEAKQKGMQKYRVELSELEGELTYKNNASTFFIEVVDQREKIAMVYHAPHPDISALRQALETSDKYEVEVFSADNFNKNVSDYSLFVLHQLPSRTPSSVTLLNKIIQSGTSALYIVGSQTDISTFNKLNTGVSIQPNIQGGKTLYNESMPYFNESFLSFTFSEEARQMLRNYTPITTFFGNYNTAVGTNVFMYQKINGVESTYPLITFNSHNATRTGVITGTDIWRWRMQNYLRAQNTDAFDEIVNQMALYLAAKGDKSLFRVHAEELYNENNTVEITAEVYNESHELITTPDVKFKLKDAEGKEYTSQFSKQNNSYTLNLGKLPVGDYEWEATTVSGQQTLTKSGHFSVQEILLENINLVADHNLLRTLSDNTHGQSFNISQLDQVEKAIRSNENIKPIVNYNQKYSPFLDSWLYFIIIILLLGVEWFMRKWGGGY